MACGAAAGVAERRETGQANRLPYAPLQNMARTHSLVATPDMAVTLLEIARIFATKVPSKIDADVLQLLWKTCLVGAGPDGKHTALEAVTIVLDLPPLQPGSMSGFAFVDMQALNVKENIQSPLMPVT
ncbi:hypothetical protein E2562_037810 [Oryza meyeriana var. granulata]|uniref:Uncharacterized protein n=1 Tax=Oryza meyeriana var. granulata TaxID=110450 RepID=A0A6G1DVI7_9ORYZ|nr:hypothetical protein E2562_037810 [Oryza meyeriana var. granulata]